MESYNLKTGENEETPKKVIKFLEDLEALCRIHNVSISHEDGGRFELDEFDEYNIEWVRKANLNL